MSSEPSEAHRRSMARMELPRADAHERADARMHVMWLAAQVGPYELPGLLGLTSAEAALVTDLSEACSLPTAALVAVGILARDISRNPPEPTPVPSPPPALRLVPLRPFLRVVGGTES